MITLHEKSLCCRGKIRRFGKRRRQCIICKKTWRVWRKHRGRKKKRISNNFFVRYLKHEIPPLSAMARKYNLSEVILKNRLKRSRDVFLTKTLWPSLPKSKNLIIIADAMVIYTKEGWYTFYFILCKKIKDSEAIITPPNIIKGTETTMGWYETLDKFSEIIKVKKANIKAIVCDGHRGFISYAKWNNILIQRCHFHLIARLQSRRSKWKHSQHREEGERIYKLVKEVLTNPNEKAIVSILDELEEISWSNKSPEIRKTLAGFVNHYRDFRTYLYHPSLHLPTTSNTAESFIGCIKGLRHKARGFRTLDSFQKWICALIKHKKKIKCNGYYQPN